jgi:diaminohydroxyphosphoribosylaminopyrimidine deaminase/5-amino-6-(5-phosphoribosylamino)uracil reductase
MRPEDVRWMSEVLDLARGPLFTSPNPRVGAILVRDGELVSGGAHEGWGSPHAEAITLKDVDATGGTLYVNLEPCAHQGRTPPCVPGIIDSGVTRVVVAVADPDTRVNGRGLRLLEEAGIEVVVGVLAEEARWLNGSYLHHRRTGRAYLSLKLALSLDGRMGARDGSSRWISGPEARTHVHRRRVEADAVLVGAGTVLVDDPSLDARVDVEPSRQPLRVVLDPSGRVPATARVFDREGTLVIATDAMSHEHSVALKEVGAEVLVLPRGAGGIDVRELLIVLGARNIAEVFCEGGGTLATGLLRADLVERLELHHGPVLLGRGGPEIGDLGVGDIKDGMTWRLRDVERFGGTVMTTYERSR